MEMSKRGLKTILRDVVALVESGYGSYNDIIQLTYREIADVQTVRVSISQEQAILEASK